MSIFEAVSNVTLFSGLAKEYREKLAAIGIIKTYNAGSAIFEAGAEASGLYAVASGQIKIYRASSGGKEQILHVFGPGEAFGEVPVFEGATFPASAQAIRESKILFFPRPDFHTLIQGDPDLAMNMLGLLCARLRKFVNQISQLSLKEVPSRLASHLLLLQASHSTNTFDLDMPKGQIASYLGTAQETLSRELKKFVQAKYITMKGKHITILNPKALQTIAEAGR